MAINTKRVVARYGMAFQIPALQMGEFGWDVDFKRLRVGDDSNNPTVIMTNKSLGPFEYNNIDYVQYPQIRMLPEGTVDGVDISRLNAANGILVRRGNNLWAHRAVENNDGYLTITNGNGVGGNVKVNLSASFLAELDTYLTYVAVDDVTIHGDGTPANPLYSHTGSTTEKGAVRFATRQETYDGSINDAAVTPDSLRYAATNSPPSMYANTGRSGFLRIATQTETIDANINGDGVGANVVTSPYLLRNVLSSKARNTNWYASETRSGVVELASEAETLAGVNDENVLTPFKLKRYFDENAMGGMYHDQRLGLIQAANVNTSFTVDIAQLTFPYFFTGALISGPSEDRYYGLRVPSTQVQAGLCITKPNNLPMSAAYTFYKGKIWLMHRYVQIPNVAFPGSDGRAVTLYGFPADYSPEPGSDVNRNNSNNAYIGNSFDIIFNNYTDSTLTIYTSGSNTGGNPTSRTYRWRRDFI